MSVSLTSPGTQTNNDGDVVGINLAATDSAGHSLAYSVDPSAPLPTGLTLNAGTGRIFGQIDNTRRWEEPVHGDPDCDRRRPMSSASQTLTWTANAATPPSNDTVTTLENTPVALTAADFGLTSGDGVAGVKITTLPTGGTLTDNGVPVTVGQSNPRSDLNNLACVYTPNHDEFGSAYDGLDFAPYTSSGPGAIRCWSST